MNVDSQVPDIPVLVQHGDIRCQKGAECGFLKETFNSNHIESYVGRSKEAKPKIISAVIDLDDFGKAVELNFFNENFKRNIKKARKYGYSYQPFSYANFVPDIYEINTSLKRRTGRLMASSYLRNVKELGGYPAKYAPFKSPLCPLHNDTWHGLFRSEPGHLQGSVLVDRRLVAYVRLRRNGNFAFYSLILGHGAHLKYGIMHSLHHGILTNLLSQTKNRLKYLVYAGAFQGLEGLQRWKREALFKPATLYLGHDRDDI